MSTKTVMMRVLVGFGIWFVHGVWCFAASGACATGTFGEKISHRQVDPREAIQKAPGIDTLKNRSQVFSSLRKTFHFLFFWGVNMFTSSRLRAPGGLDVEMSPTRCSVKRFQVTLLRTAPVLAPSSHARSP